MLCDSGKHARSDLIGVVEREGKIGKTATLQDPVGPLAFALKSPADLQQRPLERACPAGAPGTRAATVKTFSSSGVISP